MGIKTFSDGIEMYSKKIMADILNGEKIYRTTLKHHIDMVCEYVDETSTAEGEIRPGFAEQIFTGIEMEFNKNGIVIVDGYYALSN